MRCPRRVGKQLSWKRIGDTGAARKRRVTRVISTMETGAPRAIPGGVGVSALWVQRFAIITFRACRFVCINSVRQFPLCGVHSRVRERESPPSCPSRPSVARSVPDEREALRGSVSRLYPPSPLLPRLCSRERERETRERPDPFQEGPAVRESANACSLFLAPFSLPARLPPIFSCTNTLDRTKLLAELIVQTRDCRIAALIFYR